MTLSELLYNDNKKKAIALAAEMELLIADRKRHAIKYNFSSLEDVNDHLEIVEMRLNDIWNEQVTLFFIN